MFNLEELFDRPVRDAPVRELDRSLALQEGGSHGGQVSFGESHLSFETSSVWDLSKKKYPAILAGYRYKPGWAYSWALKRAEFSGLDSTPARRRTAAAALRAS